MNELALFAGAGGGILGGKLLGWNTVCAVEWGEYPASVLCARQNEGLLPPFPIWDDVQTFDGKPWRGIVDVVSGGFPCQDISVAGKGAGIDGERSGMWSHMARIIGEVRPRFAFVENSPALLTRGFGVVLGDLAALGYDCKWTVLGAADVGANHKRDRFWLRAEMAYTNGIGGKRGRESGICTTCAEQCPAFKRCIENADAERLGSALADTCSRRYEPQERKICSRRHSIEYSNGRAVKSRLGRTFDGLAERLDAPWDGDWENGTPRVATGITAKTDRLKAIGNGQVPLCAATAWRMLGGPIA